MERATKCTDLEKWSKMVNLLVLPFEGVMIRIAVTWIRLRALGLMDEGLYFPGGHSFHRGGGRMSSGSVVVDSGYSW